MSGTVASHPPFFVMKQVDGVPLDAVIRAHPRLPIRVVQALLLQLCAGLQHAHDRSVVHGNVKPANILVDARGNLHVTDFGIATAAEYARVMRTAMAIGVPEYMSPEQCLGQPTSVASDQYSVGAIGYELLAARPPFVGPPVEVQRAHLSDLPPWVGFARRDCPTPLAAAVMRMLAKEPNERWPALRNATPFITRVRRPNVADARSALARLVRFTPSVQSTITMTPPGHPAQRAVRRSTRVLPIPGGPRPSKPVPVASLNVAPRSHTPAFDAGARFRTTGLREHVASTGGWSRRLAIAAGLLAAATTVVWLELIALGRRPNDIRTPAGIVSAPRTTAPR
jgi:serine/threonine protein kinase